MRLPTIWRTARSKRPASSRFFAVIETEHLFIKVTEQMKRLYTNVGSSQPALEQRPEVLKAVRVYAAIYVLLRMIDDLMRVSVASPYSERDRQ